MKTLEQLYKTMDQLAAVRREAVSASLAGVWTRTQVSGLRNAWNALDELPLPPGRTEGRERRVMAGDREVTVMLDYEFDELEKDLRFMEDGELALEHYLASRHDDFRREVERLSEYLAGQVFHSFLTDRDGTVNNYCGRYRSSHQATYNAVFLTRFVRTCTKRSVILTSAPLDNGGLLSLTAMPEGSVCYAGSAGREYRSESGERGSLSMTSDQKRHLKELNERIGELLSKPENRVFATIGSGVQYKFGQTTVSRQDIQGSIPEEKSLEFAHTVSSLMRSVDPSGRHFRISDTGKDIEIILTVNGDREFTKGDGAEFLDDKLGLRISEGTCLVCGDTKSDIAMAEYAVRTAGPDHTWVVFVTEDPDLQKSVREIAPNARFASTPDVLVSALNATAKESRT